LFCKYIDNIFEFIGSSIGKIISWVYFYVCHELLTKWLYRAIFITYDKNGMLKFDVQTLDITNVKVAKLRLSVQPPEVSTAPAREKKV
jgi:hypothetical protein